MSFVSLTAAVDSWIKQQPAYHYRRGYPQVLEVLHELHRQGVRTVAARDVADILNQIGKAEAVTESTIRGALITCVGDILGRQGLSLAARTVRRLTMYVIPEDLPSRIVNVTSVNAN